MPSTSISPSSRRSPHWLRHPLVWIAVVCAALMGGLITSSYIGGLVDPVGHLQDAPIGFVNADRAVTVGTTQLDAGTQIEQQVVATGGRQIDWEELDSQAEAERRIRDDDLWGAIVVPEGFSAAVAGMATAPATAQPAQLVVLTNEGAGLFQPSFFAEVSDEAVAATSSSVRQQLVTLLDQAGTTLTADAAAVIGDPVVASETAVVELPAKAGRGIAPFYLTVMITLSGFLAASIVGVGVDLLRGSDRLELLGRPVELRPGGHDRGSPGAGAPQAGDEIRPLRLWLTKAFPTLVAAVLAGLAAVFAALVLFGMDVSSAPKAYAVGALGSAAVAMISLWFLTLFGIAGELVGVLFTTILGVPAALGIYPYQAVPGFFRFVAAWHPMRFLSDAMRSIAFFGGSGAGLGRGVVVVAAWLVGAIVVGLATAWLLDRRVGRSSSDEPGVVTSGGAGIEGLEGSGSLWVDTSDAPAPAPRSP
jgi:YhgE/Pip-like protein